LVDTATAALFASDDAPPALLAGIAALARLRVFALIGQSGAMTVALAVGVRLAIVPMIIVIAALLALTLRTRRRLARATPATHGEIFAHAMIDVGAFSIVLACAGGDSNPFVLLYLVHVVMMALLLPPRQAVIGVALVVAAAATVATIAPHVALADGSPLPASLHALGWFASLALTATITAWLVMRVVASLHAYGRDLGEARRAAANDEAVLRIGALAAGAAHELGTPLATMAIVVGEMQRNAKGDAERRDAGILAAQIAACRQTLLRLRANAGGETEGGGAVALDAFLERLFDRFRSTRPGIALTVRVDAKRAPPRIFADASLGQALLNLLNNAADASPAAVGVTVGWDDGALQFTVDDEGAGIPEHALAKLGRECFTTKPPGQGTGLGLLLTATVIARLGGTVRWSNRSPRGARADVRLPLAALTLQESFQ
jgi:two-component system sensor histidine kinase RegB